MYDRAVKDDKAVAGLVKFDAVMHLKWLTLEEATDCRAVNIKIDVKSRDAAHH